MHVCLSKFHDCEQGYSQLVSVNGLHQLHILIFFLAVFHVLYSAITMMLGRLKVVYFGNLVLLILDISFMSRKTLTMSGCGAHLF